MGFKALKRVFELSRGFQTGFVNKKRTFVYDTHMHGSQLSAMGEKKTQLRNRHSTSGSRGKPNMVSRKRRAVVTA